MRKIALLLLFFTSSLSAQTVTPVGNAAARSSSSSVQNWIFASGGILAAAAGMTAIACTMGSNSH